MKGKKSSAILATFGFIALSAIAVIGEIFRAPDGYYRTPPKDQLPQNPAQWFWLIGGFIVMFFLFHVLLTVLAKLDTQRRERIMMKAFGNLDGKLTADHINKISEQLRDSK